MRVRTPPPWHAHGRPLLLALGQALALIAIGYYCKRLDFIPAEASVGMGALAGAHHR